MKYINRCNATKNLEIHYIYQDGEKDLQNAQVLFQECHENTDYGKKGNPGIPFPDKIKEKALLKAENLC